jgi:hypothetical protein
VKQPSGVLANSNLGMRSYSRLFTALAVISILCILPVDAQQAAAQTSGASSASPAQIHSLKITLLSTMLVGDLHPDNPELGEWGFSALALHGHRSRIPSS